MSRSPWNVSPDPGNKTAISVDVGLLYRCRVIFSAELSMSPRRTKVRLVPGSISSCSRIVLYTLLKGLIGVIQDSSSLRRVMLSLFLKTLFRMVACKSGS